MSENTSRQEVKQWKQQYYDHLDLLDRKEKDWQALESILKKTVLRLSIAAEGQHATIDRHLHDIRSVVKKQINVIRLENILGDISAILLKMGDKKDAADRKVITMLSGLIEKIDFPDTVSKQKNKLIKKLSRSSDKDSENLVDEVYKLLSISINRIADSSHEKTRPGLLNGLFKSKENIADNNRDTAGDTAIDCKAGHVIDHGSIVDGISRVTKAMPWPAMFKKEVDEMLAKMSVCNSRDFDKHLEALFSLVSKWQQQAVAVEENPVAINVDTDDIDLIADDMQNQPDVLYSAASSHSKTEEQGQVSAQEILIRLLEQLTFSPDLYGVVESLKQRIEVESSSTGWKQLLKDVAQLINTLRSQMQEEKHEFETFLQQITSRLLEMEGFLSMENVSLIEAEKSGEKFDVVVSAQVQDIHDDMNTTDDLNDLKSKVEKRLNLVSGHIRQYRISEQERYSSAQQNVVDMQSRLQLLEQESENLKKLIVEKNREAMFDVLTNIPNRLSYEKKAAEEIARCKRFARPLSMAVWDVDLFKQVNDTYGHKVGDMVLKAIAQLLNERMRETDFIARYGGEEFVMFLPGADEANALEVANVLREKISACKFKHHEDMLKITVSCGISSFIKGDNHESMFERADKALYAAKHNGRNQCMAISTLTNR